MTMNEVFARRDVIEQAKLRELCAPSNWAGVCQAASHIGALLLSGSLLWWLRSTLWAVPLFVAHGILLNFLYAGQHELSHWTVFARHGLTNGWDACLDSWCFTRALSIRSSISRTTALLRIGRRTVN